MLNGYFLIIKIMHQFEKSILVEKMKVTQEIQISKSENEIELGRIFKNLNTLR